MTLDCQIYYKRRGNIYWRLVTLQVEDDIKFPRPPKKFLPELTRFRDGGMRIDFSRGTKLLFCRVLNMRAQT